MINSVFAIESEQPPLLTTRETVCVPVEVNVFTGFCAADVSFPKYHIHEIIVPVETVLASVKLTAAFRHLPE